MIYDLKKSFKLSILCVAIACATASAYALEELEELGDYELGEATGEGVALLPENFSLRLNEPLDSGRGANGAGYIRLIPVGPLSTSQESRGYQKADVYLYGLSLGQSKQNLGVGRTAADWGEGFGNIGTGAQDFGRKINSWGSADNPWIFKTLTRDVPNFANQMGSISHFNVEAPLRHQTIPASTSAEASAYNLKMGLWVDAFMRNKAIAEVPGGYDGLSNRVRLSAVWDGFGLNGSNFKFFQTLGGVTNAQALSQGLSTSYNNTLGLAALIRLNSFDTRVNVDASGNFTSGFGGIVTRTAQSRTTAANPASIAANAVLSANNMVQTYGPITISGYQQSVCGSVTNRTGTASDGLNSQHCLTREAIATRTHSSSISNSWVAPSIPSVFRVSTRATENSTTQTPALSGLSAMPDFDTNEGVYLYGLNANIVLGSLHQPLIFNTPDGANFSVELTRIPNQEKVYSRIYQAYGSTLRTPTENLAYLGNTCNFYRCGDAVTLNGVTYQGSSATHSSITIGSVVYNATTNQIDAYKGVEALGISFGPIQSVSTQTLTSTVSQSYQQVYRSERGTCPTSWGSCSNFGAWGNWQAVAATKYNQGDYDRFVLGHTTPETRGQVLGVTSNVPTTNNLVAPGKTVSNNFGSAAIDGLLIQHFKMTTTGLN